MKRDEEREADAKHDEWDEEVAIGEDGFGFAGDAHLCLVDCCMTDQCPVGKARGKIPKCNRRSFGSI